MDYRVSYEHSLADAPDDFIAQVPDQLITDVPPTVPRALLPEYIAGLIRERSSEPLLTISHSLLEALTK